MHRRNATRRTRSYPHPRRLARLRRLALGITLTTTATAQACALKDEAPASAEQTASDRAATPVSEPDAAASAKADAKRDVKSEAKPSAASSPKRKDKVALGREVDPLASDGVLGGEAILEETESEEGERTKNAESGRRRARPRARGR